eukprot:SAG22_NODE_4825_length_1155_cov_1.438032_1_plen_288_part_01
MAEPAVWLTIERAGMLAAEVCTVLAVLRLNSRFELAGSAEHPLVAGLQGLSLRSMARQPRRREGSGGGGGGAASRSSSAALGPAAAVRPFLEIVRSPETNGPVTGEALHSVARLLEQDFLPADAPSAATAMLEIADAVMGCRFEDTDPETDAVVLMRLLAALRACFTIPAGRLLPDEAMMQMARACFDIARELRRPLLLRTLVEQVLLDLARTVCRRLPEFEPAELVLEQGVAAPRQGGEAAGGGQQDGAGSDSDEGQLLGGGGSGGGGGGDGSFCLVEASEPYGPGA